MTFYEDIQLQSALRATEQVMKEFQSVCCSSQTAKLSLMFMDMAGILTCYIQADLGYGMATSHNPTKCYHFLLQLGIGIM